MWRHRVGSFAASRGPSVYCSVRALHAAREGVGDSPRVAPPRIEPRRHRKLYTITQREEQDEQVRDFLPEKPLLPGGWSMEHTVGSNRFDLKKTVEIRSCGVEELHVVALMERKEYEETYRMDNGERSEQEYLNFTLFLRKQRYPNGGLEFALTSIDMELVMDSLAVHPTNEQFLQALESFGSPCSKSSVTSTGTSLQMRRRRDNRYRGPMLSELDDDLSDEILDYLDERGVNNAFAEFMLSQAYYVEQQEYLNWLRLLRRFAD